MTTSFCKNKLKKIPIQPIDVLPVHFERTRYIYNAYRDGNILVIDFYEKDKEGPTIRTFLESKRWLSLGVNTGKWSTAMITNVLNICVYYFRPITDSLRPFKMSSWGSIEDWLGCATLSTPAILSLINWQETVRADQLKSKHQKIKDRIDERMLDVKDLPEDFKEWVFETVFKNERYIFYNYTGRKKQTGYCTYCKNQVSVEGAKHLAKGICPECGSVIEFRGSKKSANIYEEKIVSFLDRNASGDGFHLRIFDARRVIRKGQWTNTIDRLNEVTRIFYPENFRGADIYSYGCFKNTKEVRWCDDIDTWNFKNMQHLYPFNIKAILPKQFKYCALDVLAEQGRILKSLNHFFQAYEAFPEMEYFIKMGLTHIALDLPAIHHDPDFRIDRKAKKPANYLQLDEETFSICRQLNTPSIGIKFLQAARSMGLRFTKDALTDIQDRYKFSDTLLDCLPYMSYTRLRAYLSKHEDPHRLYQTLSNYRDYLKMSADLGYDMTNDFILYPKNLKKAHDDVMKRTKIEKDKKMKAKLAILFGQQELYRYEDDDFLIRAPKDLDELVAEGHKLHHCVGTYAGRIADGKTVVVFIRKKKAPKTPFATLEVRDGDLIQCRGKNNKDMTEELKKLLTVYNKKVLNKDKKAA